MAEAVVSHVLIVEDDEPSLRLAKRVLDRVGYRVTTRPWPDLAPSAVAALAPDAIVLDLMFGRKPLGKAFLESLKADPATASIPVLICSADVFGVREAQEQFATDACGVLLKPYRPAALISAVASCGVPGDGGEGNARFRVA